VCVCVCVCVCVYVNACGVYMSLYVCGVCVSESVCAQVCDEMCVYVNLCVNVCDVGMYVYTSMCM